MEAESLGFFVQPHSVSFLELCFHVQMLSKVLWTRLPSDLRERFESRSKKLELKRGEMVYRQGESPRGIYFVERGLIGLTLLAALSGKEHLLRFYRQGQFFGHRALFANEEYHASTLALEPSVVQFISKEVIFEALREHPELYQDVVSVLAKELRRCEVQRVMILENQVLSRTAQALIYLKDLHPNHNWTRQEIANFTASTVSTIIKTLSQLEIEGLIEQKGRAINILDRDRLIALQDLENG